jgi:hypothetical protein
MIRDQQSGAEESLERSIACFWVAISRARDRGAGQMGLQSFPWIAAVTCLQEVERLRMMTPLF